MAEGTKTRLTAEQKIEALRLEIKEREAKAAEKAQALAGAKRYQLDQAEARIQAASDQADALVTWFQDAGIDPTTVEPVAPVKKEKADSA